MARANSWITSALLPTLSPSGKTIGSGTPMNSGDPFMTLVEAFGSHKIPLSYTSFPDRFTRESIDRKREQFKKLGQMRDWRREYELVLTDDASRLFAMDKLSFVDEMPDGVRCFMTCDLAFSEKTGADFSALIVNGVDSEGNWFIYPVQGQWKPSVTAAKIFKLVNRFQIQQVGIEQGSSFIAVEEHLKDIMKREQTFFSIKELKHGSKSKISRISALEPVVAAGVVSIVDTGEDSEALVDQMEKTDSLECAAKNDDLLDAMAYMVQMNLFYSENAVSSPLYDEDDEDEDIFS